MKIENFLNFPVDDEKKKVMEKISSQFNVSIQFIQKNNGTMIIMEGENQDIIRMYIQILKYISY